MADPNPHEVAAGLILDRVRDVDDRDIHKRLEEYDLTADESEALADEVQELIATAALTVSFSDTEKESR
jgi:hypothetical protein